MRKAIFLTFIFSCLLLSLQAQPDSSLTERLPQPIENCEAVATNSQQEILKMEIYETERIETVLNIWSSECGETEPIQRLRILMAIHKKELVLADYEGYLNLYVEKFIDRVLVAQDADYQDVYESHKGYFSYVPLKASFDAMTKEVALQLLPNQVKHSPAYSLALLFSEQVKAFEKATDSRKNKLYEGIEQENTDTFKWSERPVAGVEVGWWIPDTKLSRFFDPGPYIGFKVGYPVKPLWLVDLNVGLNIPVDNAPYRINLQDSIQQTDSDLLVSIGLGLTRRYVIKENWSLDGSVGIGVHFMDTDIPKDEFAEEVEYYSLVTFDFNMGAMIRKKVFQRHSIGLSAVYHFAPYGINKRLVDVFGDQSFTVGLAYFF